MDFTLDQVLGRAVRKQLIGLVRHHAGTFPGETILDVHSYEGFLAEGLAEVMPRAVILSGNGLEDEGRGVEGVTLELPSLPFEDGKIAAVTGAWLEKPLGWSDELAAELERVLVPKGRILFLGRGPSARAAGFEATLPEGIVDGLVSVGLGGCARRRLMHLLDGTEVVLVEGTKGW